MYASIQFKLRTLIKRGEGEFRGCFELQCSAPKYRLAPDKDKGNGVASSLSAFASRPSSKFGEKTAFAGINETWPGLVLATCIVPPIDTCHMRGRGGEGRGRRGEVMSKTTEEEKKLSSVNGA